MKKIAMISLALGGLLLVGASCSLYGGTRNNTTMTPAAANEVSIANFAFSPAELAVAKGATVTWINNDSAPHQIKAPAFNSGWLAQGDKFSFTFTAAGTFDYTCAIHPFMAGKIIVQ